MSERSGPGRGMAATRSRKASAPPEGTDALAVLAEQGPDQGDVAGADAGIADAEAAAHLALGIGEAMRGAIGAEQVGVGEGARIAPIGRDPARAGGVHGGEVGVGDDDLMAELLETEGDPLAVGRGLDEDARPGARAEDAAKGSGSVRMRCSISSPPSARIQIQRSLLWTSMPIWSMAGRSSLRRWPRVALGGRICHHVEREASRFHLI
jgi:hypothetical protein